PPIADPATQTRRDALGRRLAETSPQRLLLDGLKERFGLPKVPRRIEVFDNSHIQGASAVGAMIVAGGEGFVKNQDRRVNIRSADLAPGDDYSMMRGGLARRVKRLLLDEAEAPGVGPVADAPTFVRVARAAKEGSSDPVAGSAEAEETPASRIEQPQPPPIDQRGGSALAFGVLRADRDGEGAIPMSEAELAMLEADADARPQQGNEESGEERDGASDEFPARPDPVL